MQLVSLDVHGLAERMVYGGDRLGGRGHASAGMPSGAQTWPFAEGTGVAPFDTWA